MKIQNRINSSIYMDVDMPGLVLPDLKIGKRDLK